MILQVNQFSFVNESKTEQFFELVHKDTETGEFYVERNGKKVSIRSKNDMVVHKHNEIVISDEIFELLK